MNKIELIGRGTIINIDDINYCIESHSHNDPELTSSVYPSRYLCVFVIKDGIKFRIGYINYNELTWFDTQAREQLIEHPSDIKQVTVINVLNSVEFSVKRLHTPLHEFDRLDEENREMVFERLVDTEL